MLISIVYEGRELTISPESRLNSLLGYGMCMAEGGFWYPPPPLPSWLIGDVRWQYPIIQSRVNLTLGRLVPDITPEIVTSKVVELC